MERDAMMLLATIEWTRARMVTLSGHTDDVFVRRNLHALIRALDPATNPRLAAVLTPDGEEGEPAP